MPWKAYWNVWGLQTEKLGILQEDPCTGKKPVTAYHYHHLHPNHLGCLGNPLQPAMLKPGIMEKYNATRTLEKGEGCREHDQLWVQELFIPVVSQHEVSQIKQLVVLCFLFIKKEICNYMWEAIGFAFKSNNFIYGLNIIFSLKRPSGPFLLPIAILKNHQN